MNTIAIIPARGRSKGIARKNLALIGGKPLIWYSILRARINKNISRLVVDTDNDEIEKYVKSLKIDVVRRPKNLGDDDIHATQVITHTIDFLKVRDNDSVIMLLPTSPLRKSSDIQRGMNIFNSYRPDSVIGVCESPPYISFRGLTGNGNLTELPKEADIYLQRQDLKPTYIVNGAFFMTTAGLLRRNGTFHMENSKPLIMDEESSINIDTPFDLKMVNALLRLV